MDDVCHRPSTQSGEASSEHRSCFAIGNVSVEVSGRLPGDVVLAPSLRPFRVGTGDSDININVEWVDDLSPTMGARLFDSGTTWRLYESDCGFEFDISAAIFGKHPYKKLLIDHAFRQATLQMSQKFFGQLSAAPQPLEYPLDELLIMHRLTQEKAIELHGSGIVRADGIGNLFVGHSGAGKSTTTRLWTEREEVSVLSDDRIIIRRDDGCSRRIRMYGTPWHGEAMYALPESAPLARILVLQHGRGNVLTKLTPSQAVSELFARSFVPFHRHEYVDSALVFLQEVVDTVPVYRYEFEPDERAVETIRNFHD
jgi:hypothetical protein